MINNGKIVTTEAKAKEVQKIVDGLIALAVKEKDNLSLIHISRGGHEVLFSMVCPADRRCVQFL